MLQRAGNVLALFSLLVLTPVVGSGAALVVFEEEMTGSGLTTRTIDLLGPGDAKVFKFVMNMTDYSWSNFVIELQTVTATGLFAGSPAGDGISFGDPFPFDVWAAATRLDVNGSEMPFGSGDWTVARSSDPVDRIEFQFNTFQVAPGDRLALVFDITDNDPVGSKWRLHQSIPEPNTAALVLLAACMGVVRLSRRP